MKFLDRFTSRSPEEPEEQPSGSRKQRLGIALAGIGLVGIVGSMVAGSMGFEYASETVVASGLVLGAGSMAVIASGLEAVNNQEM